MAQPAQDQVVFLLIVGTIGILALIAFIVFFFFLYQRRILILQQEKRDKEIEFEGRMAQARLESQERERVRIASDLHDTLGSLLWGAKVNASFLEKSLTLSGETKESHQELIEILDQSLQSVKRISGELSPEAFYDVGLSQSLFRLCKRFNGKGPKVLYEENEAKFWNDDKALQVFRIVQELVTNSIKHSQASVISVIVHWNSNFCQVRVQDNGLGLDAGAMQGVGWWSIRQRAGFLKASIDVGETPIEKRGKCFTQSTFGL